MAPYNLLKNARRVEQQQWYGGNAANGGNYGNGGYNNNGAAYNNNYAAYNNGGGEDAKEAYFLADYSLSLVSCLQNEQSLNYESGEIEQSTVIFRLCPKDTCSSSNSTDVPCDSGYGDFAIGINSFAEAYAESVKDNNNNNGMNMYSYGYGYGEFNVEEYTRECKLYEGNRDGGANNNYNNYGYNAYAYLGLACTSDGKDIRLASFSDPYCSQESSDSFSTLSNGMSLPYSEGGFIPSTCMNCMTMNDNYEYEISEMCKKTYEDASYRCEENMETYNSYYGRDTRGCNYTSTKVSSSSSAKDAYEARTKAPATSSKIFSNQSDEAKEIEGYLALLIVFGLLGAGLIVFLGRKTVKTVRKRKQQQEGEDGKDGVMAEGSSGFIPFAIGFLKESSEVAKQAVCETSNKIVAIVHPKKEEDTEYKTMDDSGYVSPDGTVASA